MASDPSPSRPWILDYEPIQLPPLVAAYRRWQDDGAHQSGRVDPIEMSDVAHECEHERLPRDRCPSPDGVWPYDRPCACHSEPGGVTPPEHDARAAKAVRDGHLRPIHATPSERSAPERKHERAAAG